MQGPKSPMPRYGLPLSKSKPQLQNVECASWPLREPEIWRQRARFGQLLLAHSRRILKEGEAACPSTRTFTDKETQPMSQNRTFNVQGQPVAAAVRPTSQWQAHRTHPLSSPRTILD